MPLCHSQLVSLEISIDSCHKIGYVRLCMWILHMRKHCRTETMASSTSTVLWNYWPWPTQTRLQSSTFIRASLREETSKRARNLTALLRPQVHPRALKARWCACVNVHSRKDAVGVERESVFVRAFPQNMTRQDFQHSSLRHGCQGSQ